VRLLLDTCVCPRARDELRPAGHDVEWTGDWDRDPGDDGILARAYEEGRILVTIDKDFGELAIVHETPHCGIIRLVGLSVRMQGTVCARVLQLHGDELREGAIVTAELGRLRVRPARQ
jgi:predicted nuclease of predicted toxin-antitoxin system